MFNDTNPTVNSEVDHDTYILISHERSLADICTIS